MLLNNPAAANPAAAADDVDDADLRLARNLAEFRALLRERRDAEQADRMQSLLGRELRRILLAAEQADRARWAALAHDDPKISRDAEDERREAEGDYFAATSALSDLFFLLFRQALEHDAPALRDLLADVLRPVIEPIAEAAAAGRGRA